MTKKEFLFWLCGVVDTNDHLDYEETNVIRDVLDQSHGEMDESFIVFINSLISAISDPYDLYKVFKAFIEESFSNGASLDNDKELIIPYIDDLNYEDSKLDQIMKRLDDIVVDDNKYNHINDVEIWCKSGIDSEIL